MSHWQWAYAVLLLSWFVRGFLSPVAATATLLKDNDDFIDDSNYNLTRSDPERRFDFGVFSHFVDDEDAEILTSTVRTEFDRLRDFELDHAPFYDQLLDKDAHSMLEKDYSIHIDDHHIVDEYGTRVKTATIGQQQEDSRMTTNSTDVDYKKSLINHQTVTKVSTDHLSHHVLRYNNQQRKAQSCVRSASGLKQAFQKSGMKGYNPTIGVCAPRIPMGTLKTSQTRYLQSSSNNTTNLTIIGLDGGIDASNRSIVLTCLLKKRCILDGEGISRILYGTNTRLTIVGFQFLNATSFIGSALNFIGNSQIILQDCSFYDNTAKYGGGAILMSDSKLILKDSHRRIEFSNNGANYGGAIFGLNATIQTNITSSSYRSGIINFQDNYANRDGGAVHVTKSTVELRRVILEKNQAANGGAAMIIDTNATMTNIYVKGNSANLTGGAFVFLNASVVINNSTFDSNNGNGTIEAITVKSSNVQVTDSTFRRSRWYVKSSILNLTNSCLPQGSNCEIGASCTSCCKPYSYWVSRADKFCGSEPPIKKCFGYDRKELRNAVIDYFSGNPTVKRNLTKVYGPISDWCTSAISDWSFLVFLDGSDPFYFDADISKWDTSNATTMKGTFYNARGFHGISKWNTSKVEDMSFMFEKAVLFDQDLSKWDTSKVKDMSHMFNGAESFNQNLSRWDVSKVISMNGMFQDATIFNGNISNWDVSQVTDMSYMFNSASSFNQDIDTWDVSNVNTMYGMFEGDTAFNGNISKWNVSHVTDMSFMFNSASSFNIDISSWDVSKVINMPNMFASATSFNQDISSWNVSYVSNMALMFDGASAFNHNLCVWKDKCQSQSSFYYDTFQGTNCPNQTNPVCGIGPFCYNC